MKENPVDRCLKEIYITNLDSKIRSVKKKEESKIVKQDPDVAVALIEQLKRHNTSKKEKRIHKLLEKMGNTAVPPLVTELLNKDSEITDDIARILANMRENGLEPLIRILQSEDRSSRLKALKAICYIDDPEILPILRELLDDRDFEVRAMAAEKLVQKDEEAGLRTIIELLNDQSISISLNTVIKLDRYAGEDVTEPFFNLLTNNDREVVTEAAKALHRRNDPRAVDKFIGMLQRDESQYNTIVFAADVLSNLGDEKAVKPLVHSLKFNGPYWILKKAVQQSLLKFRTESAVRIIIDSVKDEGRFVSERICETLAMMPVSRAEPVLLKALKSEDVIVRYYAVKTLSIFRSVSSQKALEKVARNKDEDADVRQEALNGLKPYEDKAGIELLN